MLPSYRAIRPSRPFGVVPRLITPSAPTSACAGRVPGVAYVTLTVHAPPTASGDVNEQVVPVTLYKPPKFNVSTSPVIYSGALPVLVTVTKLMTGARGDGIVNVTVGMPRIGARVPLVAEVKLSVPDAATTVNVTVLLVPPGVVTLTVLAPSAAVAPIAKFALTVVAFTTVTPPAVTAVPDTVTAVAPVRFVPVSVTGSKGPGAPEEGVIEAKVGAAVPDPPATNSTAPASTAPFLRAVPKKSVLGAGAYVGAVEGTRLIADEPAAVP